MSGKFCVHCSAPDAGNYCGVCGRPQGDNPPRPGVDYDAIDADNVDMRRVKDLAFRRNPGQLMCGRGTIKIYSDENFGGKKKVGPVTLSRMGARKLYLKMRRVYTDVKAGVVAS